MEDLLVSYVSNKGRVQDHDSRSYYHKRRTKTFSACSGEALLSRWLIYFKHIFCCVVSTEWYWSERIRDAIFQQPASTRACALTRLNGWQTRENVIGQFLYLDGRVIHVPNARHLLQVNHSSPSQRVLLLVVVTCRAA